MSTPGIVLVGPPLELQEEQSLRERLDARGIQAAWALAPKDAEQLTGWRSAVELKLNDAARILVVDPSLGQDPEGRFRRELATLFARLSPHARARCIPCTFGVAPDPGQRSDARSVLAGPRGRSIGDLTADRTLDALHVILSQVVPRPAPLSSLATGAAVLSDHPVDTDGIGLQRAVSAFVELISSPSTKPPIVASVEGSWGVGKSSFLNLVRRELRSRGWPQRPKGWEERDPPGSRTVWFNAWSNDGELATFSSFALSLISELENVHFLRRMVYRIRLAAQRFNWAAGWKDMGRFLGALLMLCGSIAFAIVAALKWEWLEPHLRSHASWPEALTTGGAAAVAISGLQRLAVFFRSPLSLGLGKHVAVPDYEAKRAQRDQLYDDIAKIIGVYTSGADRLYVFIDDLDRADPAKVAELTQAIGVILAKAGAKLVYVLAIDREKVAAALAAKHKDVAGIVASVGSKGGQPLDFGQAFLEKLIQLPFRIPAPSVDDLRAWVQRMKLPTTGLGDVIRMVAPFLGLNPRRLKQFVNLLHLRLRLLDGRQEVGQDETSQLSLYQLGKLTALELLYPFFIADLVANPALVNALLIGAGPDVDSPPYRRWSAVTELLELLAVTLPPTSTGGTPLKPMELLLADRNTSLLDLDLGPLLRIGVRPAESFNPPPAIGVVGVPNLEFASGESPPPALAMQRYAREYERIRAAEGASQDRTMKLVRLFDDMTRIRGLTDEEARRFFDSGAPGQRIAALASCLAERHPSAGAILAQALELPKARFETFQALRVAKLLWRVLSGNDRRHLAIIVSNRWLNRTDESDQSIWALTLGLLQQAEGVALVDEIHVLYPEGVGVTLPFAEYPDFKRLTDRLYFPLQGRVNPFQYGAQWRLVDENVAPLKHARELDNIAPGNSVADLRPLVDLGIHPGSRLKIILL